MTLGQADGLNDDKHDHDEVRRIAVEPLGRTQDAGNHRPDNATQCNKG